MSHTSLADWLDYIQQLHPSEIDMGLDRLRQVAQRLGLGRPAPVSILISGTNGKGSHVATLQQLLRRLGYRVGAYTSPHLLHYNERVCIDGVPVNDAQLMTAFEAIEAARQDVSLSFFEFGTLAALQIFEQTALDVAILEVGLGGRLDAVNLVDADMAIITSIGLDHQDWLGDTRDAIAAEKAGIFRPGIPVVCSENDPPDSLLRKVVELDCRLLLRGRDFEGQTVAGPAAAGDSDRWQWQGTDAQGASFALHDLPWPTLAPVNVAGALQAVTWLLSSAMLPDASAQYNTSWQQRLTVAARDVLASLTLPGRQQPVRTPRGQAALLDVSHNVEAAQALAVTIGRWQQDQPDGRVFLVLAMMHDKDHAGYYHALENAVDFWYIAHFNLPRCMPAAKLSAVLRAEGAAAEAIRQYDAVAEAFSNACQHAGEGDLIVVSGSFITVSEVMQHTIADNSANRPDQEASSP